MYCCLLARQIRRSTITDKKFILIVIMDFEFQNVCQDTSDSIVQYNVLFRHMERIVRNCVIAATRLVMCRQDVQLSRLSQRVHARDFVKHFVANMLQFIIFIFRGIIRDKYIEHTTIQKQTKCCFSLYKLWAVWTLFSYHIHLSIFLSDHLALCIYDRTGQENTADFVPPSLN